MKTPRSDVYKDLQAERYLFVKGFVALVNPFCTLLSQPYNCGRFEPRAVPGEASGWNFLVISCVLHGTAPIHPKLVAQLRSMLALLHSKNTTQTLIVLTPYAIEHSVKLVTQ